MVPGPRVELFGCGRPRADGLRDVKVATLDEAYQALVAIGKGQADDLPHCEA